MISANGQTVPQAEPTGWRGDPPPRKDPLDLRPSGLHTPLSLTEGAHRRWLDGEQELLKSLSNQNLAVDLSEPHLAGISAELSAEFKAHNGEVSEFEVRRSSLGRSIADLPGSMCNPAITAADIEAQATVIRRERYDLDLLRMRLTESLGGILRKLVTVLTGKSAERDKSLERMVAKTREGLAATGITVESMPGFAVNPKAAEQKFYRIVNKAPDVKKAREAVADIRARLDKTRRLARACKDDVVTIGQRAVAAFDKLHGPGV